jgi:hypothetical protein
MKPEMQPIAKLAEQVLLEVEQAVRRFPRYHKYQHGAVLRAQAMTVAQLVYRAWRDPHGRGRWLLELAWAIDELKLSLQLGKQIQAFSSFGAFEQIARLAVELGRQCGGWQKQHAKGLNATPASPQRAQILSARTASTFEAHP